MHITQTSSDVAGGATPVGGEASVTEPGAHRVGDAADSPGSFLARQRELLRRARLSSETQRDECEAELASLAEVTGPDEVQFDEESGEGDSTGVARDRDRTVVELARATIEDVDRALGKIDDGTYGRCDNCGEAIDGPRLEALPAARLCLDCKGNPRGGGLSALIQRDRPAKGRR
ncbi:MAG TPA: TraR/DksA C4-type zinc finger protein [Acidimicrobiales bacterium]|jgi:RNA polymerase-binding transcription factor DksA